MTTPDIYVVTGATGYVGSRIAAYLRGQGETVYELGLEPSDQLQDDEKFSAFNLGEPLSSSAENVLQEADALIHCAWDFSITDWSTMKDVNQDGSIMLIETAAEHNVSRILFMSSMAAYENAQSLYGQAKYGVEQTVDTVDGVNLRPGTVFGPDPGGIIGSLQRLVSFSPVFPLIGFGQQVFYPCHEEDLAAAVHTLATSNTLPDEPVFLGDPDGCTFKELVKTTAAGENTKVFCFPFPFFAVYYTLRLLEWLGVSLGVRSDSLRNLRHRNPDINFSVAEEYGFSFRPFTADILQQ